MWVNIPYMDCMGMGRNLPLVSEKLANLLYGQPGTPTADADVKAKAKLSAVAFAIFTAMMNPIGSHYLNYPLFPKWTGDV